MEKQNLIFSIIGSVKRLEYLDLEIVLEKKYRRLKFESLLKCNFAEGDHILHSENQHLNTITDLIINLAEHSQSKDVRFLKLIETIENLHHKQNKSLEKIEQNFDFLKNQQLDIIRYRP